MEAPAENPTSTSSTSNHQFSESRRLAAASQSAGLIELGGE